MRGPNINYGPQVNGIFYILDTRCVRCPIVITSLIHFFSPLFGPKKREKMRRRRKALLRRRNGRGGGVEARELMGRGRQRASGVLRQYRAGPAARTVSDYYDECSQDSHISIFGPEFCVLNDRNHDNAVSHTAPGNAHTPAFQFIETSQIPKNLRLRRNRWLRVGGGRKGLQLPRGDKGAITRGPED